MSIPPDSILCLAHMGLSDSQVSQAQTYLEQETDWRQWLEQVELHGLAGIINAHVQAHALPIPASAQLGLKALNLRHRAAAAARFKTLSLINEAYTAEGIPFLALKGVALLPKLYHRDELRPMRDMDLLIPKAQQQTAAKCLRQIGFDLPTQQPSKYMRYVHQLPNATLTMDGFICSVELHHNAVSSDVAGQLGYPKSADQRQCLQWQGLEYQALDDVTMLHQVCRHLEGLHPGGILKLINVVDVIELAQLVAESGRWPEVEKHHSHVITTLRCLHLLNPLPDCLLTRVGAVRNLEIGGIGKIMASFTEILHPSNSTATKMKLLFSPSDWWLHLHYSVDPDRTLNFTKWLHHPWRVMQGFGQRAVSALLAGR